MEENKLLDSYLKDESNYIKAFPNIITKILLSLIFLFGSLIFTSLKDEYLVMYKKYVFENHFNFDWTNACRLHDEKTIPEKLKEFYS